MGRRLAAVVVLSLAGSPSVAAVCVIGDMPSYLWYHGCDPTAGGMIVGYWDAHGFGDLIDGGTDGQSSPAAVADMIASPGHIRDYVPTPDRTATAADPYHPDDCLADFMGTSRGQLAHGDSYDSKQATGLAAYFAYRGYADVRSYSQYVWSLWEVFTASIDAGRPVELYVDRNGDGLADHFVAAFGYDDTDPASRRYFCYNTDDHVARWYGFAPAAAGRPWGVWAGTLLDPGPIPGDADADGDVDCGDYLAAKRHLGAAGGAAWSDGDFDGDGDVDAADLGRLAENFGMDIRPGRAGGTGPTAPEPATGALLLAPAGLVLLTARRRPMRSPMTRP